MDPDFAIPATISGIPTSPLSSLSSSTLSSPPPFPDQSDGPHSDSNEDDIDGEIQGGPPLRLSQQEKLQLVVDTLRSIRWSFSQFLLIWAGAADNIQETEILLDHRLLRTQEQRREALDRAIGRIQAYENLLPSQPTISTIADEIDALIGRDYFKRFEHRSNPEDINFADASRLVETYAPTWYSLLRVVLSNQRAHRGSYTAKAQTDIIANRLYTITSIVCHSRAKKRANELPSLLSVYLLGSGVKRRVIESLSGLGICLGYHQGNRLMSRIACEGEVRPPTFHVPPS